MTDEAYALVQQQLVMFGRLLDGLDLDAFIRRAEMADNVSWFVDPTLYRAGHVRLAKIKQLATKAREMRATYRELQAEVAQP